MFPYLPPFFGHPQKCLVVSTFIKDLATYEKTLEVVSIAYYIWIPHPSSYPQWEVYLHLYLVYLLPKGRNVICWYWIFFCLQALIIWGLVTKEGISSRYSLLYVHHVCHNEGVLITPSIHASFSILHISLFGEGFSHKVFPLSLFSERFHCITLHCMYTIAFLHGYLTWPSSHDPS